MWHEQCPAWFVSFKPCLLRHPQSSCMQSVVHYSFVSLNSIKSIRREASPWQQGPNEGSSLYLGLIISKRVSAAFNLRCA
jgi:hypothetical protein